MKKILLALAVSAASIFWNGAQAQTLITFEDLNLPVDSFWNGSDMSGGFTDGNAFFSNTYNSTYSSWGGFAYSSKTDTITSGYANMYSCIAGSGYNNSATYALGFVSAFSGPTGIKLSGASQGKVVSSAYFNNNTYAYLSMLNGDSYAKKFGGSTGNDSDWFMLTITGYMNGSQTDTVNFYLADYRFADNSKDYIVKNWTEVNLSKLGNVDSLSFALSSSDVGSYGMNTPAYFCLDNMLCADGLGISQTTNKEKLIIYPNPSNNIIHLDGISTATELRLLDMQGNVVRYQKLPSGISTLQLNISDLSSGMYIIQLIGNENFKQKTFIRL